MCGGVADPVESVVIAPDPEEKAHLFSSAVIISESLKVMCLSCLFCHNFDFTPESPLSTELGPPWLSDPADEGSQEEGAGPARP